MSKEPESVVVPATEDDEPPMQYIEVPATDEDGNPLPASKSADGDKRGTAATSKEK